jgi:GDP-D-mannose dehydratase
MTYMHKGRMQAAKALIATFEAHRDDPRISEMLVETYHRTGKGDEFDIRATITDAIADLGYRMEYQGRGFGKVVDEVRKGETPSTLEAEIITALMPAYSEEKRGYLADVTFDDLVRIAGEHNNVEMEQIHHAAPSA